MIGASFRSLMRDSAASKRLCCLAGSGDREGNVS